MLKQRKTCLLNGYNSKAHDNREYSKPAFEGAYPSDRELERFQRSLTGSNRLLTYLARKALRLCSKRKNSYELATVLYLLTQIGWDANQDTFLKCRIVTSKAAAEIGIRRVALSRILIRLAENDLISKKQLYRKGGGRKGTEITLLFCGSFKAVKQTHKFTYNESASLRNRLPFLPENPKQEHVPAWLKGLQKKARWISIGIQNQEAPNLQHPKGCSREQNEQLAEPQTTESISNQLPVSKGQNEGISNRLPGSKGQKVNEAKNEGGICYRLPEHMLPITRDFAPKYIKYQNNPSFPVVNEGTRAQGKDNGDEGKDLDEKGQSLTKANSVDEACNQPGPISQAFSNETSIGEAAAAAGDVDPSAAYAYYASGTNEEYSAWLDELEKEKEPGSVKVSPPKIYDLPLDVAYQVEAIDRALRSVQHSVKDNKPVMGAFPYERLLWAKVLRDFFPEDMHRVIRSIKADNMPTLFVGEAVNRLRPLKHLAYSFMQQTKEEQQIHVDSMKANVKKQFKPKNDKNQATSVSDLASSALAGLNLDF